MVERVGIANENKDDDELEMLLGEIHHHHHHPSHANNHDRNDFVPVVSQTMNAMMYGMYDDDPSCSYKQNACISPQSNGSFSSFFSKGNSSSDSPPLDDPTPKPHLFSRSYSSKWPYFGTKIDDNSFGELGLSLNQREVLRSNRIEASDYALVQSPVPRSSVFSSEINPSFLGFNGMRIPIRQAENMFPHSSFDRSVLNHRYPVSYQRGIGIPALDLAVPNGLYRARQNGMFLMDQMGIRVQPNMHNVPLLNEDSLIFQGESLNQVRNKGIGGFRGQNKKTNHSQFVGICDNGRISGANSSFTSPIRCNTLAEAQGHIFTMAKDQHGCRFLQKVFDEGNPHNVQIVFNEIIKHVIELMINPFGNYLMQKLLEVCNEEQRMNIIMVVTREPRELVQISLNTHGTRVVQKLIETLKTRQQVKMVISALEPGFLALIKDLNGNHVIQRCLQCLSNEDNKFIFEAAAKFCVDIATHQHGCCVLQRCINHSTGNHQERLVLEISANGLLLAQDAFGNYVVQSILELQIPSAVSMLISQFESNYVHLATQKFSSHVVEKCLSVLNDQARSMIIRELLSAPHFEHLLQDPHANYVVQTALRVAQGHLHNSLVKAIESHKAISRNSPYSKRIFSNKLLRR